MDQSLGLVTTHHIPTAARTLAFGGAAETTQTAATPRLLMSWLPWQSPKMKSLKWRNQNQKKLKVIWKFNSLKFYYWCFAFSLQTGNCEHIVLLGEDNKVCEVDGSITWTCDNPSYPYCCKDSGIWWCCRDNPNCCHSKAADVLIALAKPKNEKPEVKKPEPEETQGNLKIQFIEILLLVFCFFITNWKLWTYCFIRGRQQSVWSWWINHLDLWQPFISLLLQGLWHLVVLQR